MCAADVDQSLGPTRKLTPAELAEAIRHDMRAELDAIDLYDTQAARSPDPHTSQVLRDVRDDEAEHLALFGHQLARLDPIRSGPAADPGRREDHRTMRLLITRAAGAAAVGAVTGATSDMVAPLAGLGALILGSAKTGGRHAATVECVLDGVLDGSMALMARAVTRRVLTRPTGSALKAAASARP